MEHGARFREYERRRGLRRSTGRERVAAAAARLTGHFTAGTLACRLPGVSRATVYRALPLLVAAGLLRECGVIDGRSVYERAADVPHHDHLRCLRCGAIIEFCDPRIERLQAAACRRHGFRAAGHRLEITGTCRTCAARGRAGAATGTGCSGLAAAGRR